MQNVRERTDETQRATEFLRKLLIVQLGLAGVGQLQIREIVGGRMEEVNSIVKLLRSKKRGSQTNGPSETAKR
jgi:hypothetical protein